MKRHRSEKLIIIIFLAAISCWAAGATANEHDLPFCPGERMVFKVKWSFIPAGEAALEVLPMEQMNGSDAYHLLFTAKTNEIVDLIYKVRDRIDSHTDAQMTHTLRYRKQSKGKSLKDVVVEFDWKKARAQYSNLVGKREPIPLKPGTFDPLSVFYAFRLNDPNISKEIRTPVTDGKKCIIGVAKVIGREDINVAGVSYDTFLVEPELEHIGGVFQKSKNAKLRIWVTADKTRIPVRIKSRLIVGSFVAELISYERGCATSNYDRNGKKTEGISKQESEP